MKARHAARISAFSVIEWARAQLFRGLDGLQSFRQLLVRETHEQRVVRLRRQGMLDALDRLSEPDSTSDEEGES
jgi:hypothetical protein